MKKFLLSIFCCLMAVFAVQAQSYVKVTSAPADWSGDYLIVYEADGLAFNGGLEVLDVASNTIAVTIADNAIEATDVVNAAKFTINASGNILSASGYYIGQTSNANGLKSSTSTTYTNTLSLNADGSVNVVSSGSAYLRYNANKDQLRFRYFKSSTYSSQKAIALYKYTETTAGEGGEGGDTPDTPVDEAPAAPTLPAACSFDDAMTVEITGIAEGATAYYSLNNETGWVEGTSVEITETTTVYAKVVKDELSSEVVSATYTKNVVLEEGMMMITFVTSTSDKSQAATVDNFVNDHIEEHNFETTLTCSATEKCYIGVDGLKMGTKSANGSFTLSLGGSYKVKSIVVNAVRYSSDVAVLSVNGAAEQTLTTSLADYTFDVNSEISQIKVDMTKRGYISHITVICEDGADTPEPVAPNAPILPEEITFEGSMMVEITGIAADATVYYTTDESDPATSATRVEYTVPFEITATTTVKAVAVNEVGASEPATATYTLFVVEETAGYYMKVVAEPADWSGKYLIVYEEAADAYVFNGKDEANGYVSATTDGDVIKANSEIDAVAVTVAAMEGGYSIKTADGYIYGASGSNKLNFDTSEGQLNTIELTADGVVITAGEVLRFNSTSNQMRFRYYKSGQQPVQLYKYVEELPLSHTLTVSDAGLATLFLGSNARIPSTVEAYIVKTVNNGWVSLTQVTGVLPAETGVIVKAAAGNYKLYSETTATADVEGNLLAGSPLDTYIDEEAYVLANGEKGIGLYLAALNCDETGAEGTTHFKNNANKAYLPATAVANKAIAFYGFEWNGTTGVEGVVAEGAQDGAIYDITGRRVKAITAPGIYIVNGKKVVK